MSTDHTEQETALQRTHEAERIAFCATEETAREEISAEATSFMSSVIPPVMESLRDCIELAESSSPPTRQQQQQQQQRLFGFWFRVLSLAASPHFPRRIVTDLLNDVTGKLVTKQPAPSLLLHSASGLLPLLPAARAVLPTASAAFDRAPAFAPLGNTLSVLSSLSPWTDPEAASPTTTVTTAPPAVAAADGGSGGAGVIPSWLRVVTETLHGGRSRFESGAKSAAKKGLLLSPSPDGSEEASDNKEQEKAQRMQQYLRYLLDTKVAKSEIDFDTARCRLLHSKERCPVLLCFKNDTLPTFILKADDDLRLESLAMLIVRWCNSVWEREKICCSFAAGCSPIQAVAYDITVMPVQGISAGLVEFLQGTNSIHEIRERLRAEHLAAAASSTVAANESKKKPPQPQQQFSEELDERLLCEYLAAQVSSTAEAAAAAVADCRGSSRKEQLLSSFLAASATQYLIGLKDRHNANILYRSSDASWINIDYSFCFGRAPGGSFSVESAPFRLPDEILSVCLGGSKRAAEFQAFARDFARAVLALGRHFTELETALRGIPTSVLEKLSCVPKSSSAANSSPADVILTGMRKRLFIDGVKGGKMTPEEKLIHLCGEACNHSGTRMYDSFQRKTNGIL